MVTIVRTVLKAQGAAAKGGAKSYLTNGNLSGGVGLVAFPAQYRVSGVMTFIINQNGVVYQKACPLFSCSESFLDYLICVGRFE